MNPKYLRGQCLSLHQPITDYPVFKDRKVSFSNKHIIFDDLFGDLSGDHTLWIFSIELKIFLSETWSVDLALGFWKLFEITFNESQFATLSTALSFRAKAYFRLTVKTAASNKTFTYSQNFNIFHFKIRLFINQV